MTFGSGANGCLGHGNYHDVTQVKNYLWIRVTVYCSMSSE